MLEYRRLHLTARLVRPWHAHMLTRWLIQEWIAQWLGLRDRLREPTHDGDAWWLSIRERILRYMVSRYLDDPQNPDGHTLPHSHRESDQMPPPLPLEHRRTFCRVKTPEHHPPRTCADLKVKLRSVSRINVEKRPRWRWL